MRFGRCTRFLVTVIVAAAAMTLRAQDTKYVPSGPWNELMIPGPECLSLPPLGGEYTACTEQEHIAWLKDITHWRAERRIRVGYDGWRYAMPVLQWTQSSFIQPQMMVQDRYFYDPETGRYTVDRYLDDLNKRYGGIDAVLVWSTYPNMGIDDRNQLDMIRSMPGGVAGVKEMVAAFHRRGVRVFFPIMMWDQGTRPPSSSWPQSIAELMKEIDADGVNGDTQDGVPLAFSKAAEKVGHPLAFESEGSPSDEALAWNILTWGQYRFSFVPKIDRYKWLESRHMVNISDRWSRDKTDDLQFAFFNGVGWESWENIWGIWNGITPRDEEATRRVATLERATAAFLTSDTWEPLYPTLRYGVFASRWPKQGDTVWTLVNRNEYDTEGAELSVESEQEVHYYDLYRGVELTPTRQGPRSILSFPLEGHGFGCVLALREKPSGEIAHLMTQMREMTTAALSSYPHEWKVLPQRMVDSQPTKAEATTPEGMIKIPAAQFPFKVRGIEIEGSNDAGVDVQYAWEDAPRRFHEHLVHVKAFYIDTFPVTNYEFKKFLNATHYHPSDSLNFLKDWKDGSYPQGWERKPVTWVSLEDARAYAAWAGKRLPHEWEWQYAAQGPDGRDYPWGTTWQPENVPAADQGHTLRGPDDVDKHPAGASVFGVMDLIGNVWQWTDEYVDEHTRAAILRGGSYYQPQGSIWYFPQAYRNDQHGKLLLMAPSYDRSGTVGFRCVRDAE